MPTLNIFVSFEFDKDKDLQNNFYRQAKEETNHRIRDCSLHESYPDASWKRKARNAISRCDVVVVLIGQDMHNAPGVIVETDMARSLNKPIIQVRPQGRLPGTYQTWGTHHVEMEGHQHQVGRHIPWSTLTSLTTTVQAAI